VQNIVALDKRMSKRKKEKRQKLPERYCAPRKLKSWKQKPEKESFSQIYANVSAVPTIAKYHWYWSSCSSQAILSTQFLYSAASLQHKAMNCCTVWPFAINTNLPYLNLITSHPDRSGAGNRKQNLTCSKDSSLA